MIEETGKCPFNDVLCIYVIIIPVVPIDDQAIIEFQAATFQTTNSENDEAVAVTVSRSGVGLTCSSVGKICFHCWTGPFEHLAILNVTHIIAVIGCDSEQLTLQQGFSINFWQRPNYFDQNAEGPNAQNRPAPAPPPPPFRKVGVCRYRNAEKGGLSCGPSQKWGDNVWDSSKFPITDIQKYLLYTKIELFHLKLVTMCLKCTQSQ